MIDDPSAYLTTDDDTLADSQEVQSARIRICVLRTVDIHAQLNGCKA